MYFWQQVKYFFFKELALELRERYALNGFLLYIIATIFIVYLSFIQISPITWNALYWIIILFTAINAVAKSFMQEPQGHLLYYHTLLHPAALLLAKMGYNALLLIFLSLIGLLFYSIVIHNPVQNHALFLLIIFLASTGFSFALTIISAIAAKANNKATLMAILSFPVILPILLLVIQLSMAAIEGNLGTEVTNNLWVLGAINVLLVSTGYLLFPYLWQE
jgi:heme exporter protein B